MYSWSPGNLYPVVQRDCEHNYNVVFRTMDIFHRILIILDTLIINIQVEFVE